MKLLRARVLNFRSIDDSGWVDLDQVTCLVGKNESGKTAWLQAVRKLKPIASQHADFDYELEYPRKRLQEYKRFHQAEPATVVEAVFELTDAERAQADAEFGPGSIPAGEILVSKDYANTTTFAFELDEAAVVRHLVANADLRPEVAQGLLASTTVAELREQLTALGGEAAEAGEVLGTIERWRDGSPRAAIVDRVLSPGMPAFVYFDEYSTMDGRIAIESLKQRRAANQLSQADQTFLALLRLVGVELEEFETLANQEWLISSLEAAGNSISDEMSKFWSQNRDLRVEFRLLGPDPAAPDERLRESNNLMIRIWNDRNRVSVIFDQRSHGFVWFFSFLVYFSGLEKESERELVLLLDEPALSLHATAQRDFLRFIDERLAAEHRVVYTTNSPFMIEPSRLDRVRSVEDADEHGTRVRGDLLTTSRETVFPLQAALAYELTLPLVAGDVVLVSELADYIYLTVMSRHLAALGRASLDERWTVVPVGGLQNVFAFLALMQVQVDAVVLVASSRSGLERIQDSADHAILSTGQLLPVADVVDVREADVEDLFKAAFYMRLLHESGASDVTADQLPRGERILERDSIVVRLRAALGGDFDRYLPARHLLEHPELLAEADEHTLEPWERLIDQINGRLSQMATSRAAAVDEPHRSSELAREAP